MAIAFENQSSSSLSFSETGNRDIDLSNSPTSKLNTQHAFDANTSDKPDLIEAEMFQQLLSGDHNPMPINSLIADSALSSLTFSLSPEAINNTTINNTAISNTNLNQAYTATISSISTGAHTINRTASLSAGNTVNQIAHAISGNLNSIFSSANGTVHSFSVLLPGQASLNVSTQMQASGIRSLHLNSEEEKFQSWLQENVSALSEALSKELKAPLKLSIGAVA